MSPILLPHFLWYANLVVCGCCSAPQALSIHSAQFLDRFAMAGEVVLHQLAIVGVIRFRMKRTVRVKVVRIPVDALKKIDAIIGTDDMFKALRQMLQRRSMSFGEPHLLMNMLMDAAQQVGAHIVIQQLQRMRRRLGDGEALLVFRLQVIEVERGVILSHCASPVVGV